jgi:hypothetical protein
MADKAKIQNMTSFGKKSVRRTIIFLIGSGVGFAILSIYMRFHPGRTYEIPGFNRLFAQAINSSDEAVHVQASDWPYTFLKPFSLGDAAWRERYTMAHFYCSNDKTVVALLAQEPGTPEPLYVVAYDFKNHERIQADHLARGASQTHDRIIALLQERGGREATPIDIPALNSGFYDR